METTEPTFKSVSHKQLKSMLSSIDRKRFRVDKIETTDITSWIAVRLRRIGLYRTSVIEGPSITIGRRVEGLYQIADDLSILETK